MRHRLLERQLRRAGLGDDAPTAEHWRAFLDVIAGTYAEADLDRDTLERSLTISSREMRELNEDLARSSETQLAIERDKLRAVTAVQTAVLDASRDGVLVIDPERRVVIYNHRFAEIWKIPAEALASGDERELLTCALSQLADPMDFLANVEELYTNQTDSSEDEIRFIDGTILERYSHPAIDPAGVLRGRLWVFRDVTARRLEEAQLHKTHAFLDSIVETIPNMVFVKDAEHLRFVRFNRAGEQLVGMGREQLLGKGDHDLFPASQADFFVAKDREVLSQRGVVTINEEQLETATGVRRLRTRKTPICGPDNRPLYLLGISEDITEQREREAELYLAKERAESASRAKSEFLLNMSHELRTPLNSILGFARVLQRITKGRLGDDEREHLVDIVSAGDHMLQLINDLLDLRSLEAHALDIGPVELVPPLDEAAKMVQPLLRERAQSFVVDTDPDLPPCLGARRAIVQVLVNLLTNATKFTPEHGSIELRAFRDGAMIRLQVRDTGVGIAPEDQAKLFVYFEQLKAKHQHNMKGSGVGLALTRALVEKMGGTISVSSQLGKGSTFDVKLRAAA